MSDVVICPSYGKRNSLSTPLTVFGIDKNDALRHAALMWTSERLMAALRDAGVKQVEIARALGIAESRVSEMYKGERRIQLDEAAKLVEKFGLSETPALSPLTTPIARLLVHHVARQVGVVPGAELVAELAADLRAFSAFAADHQVRDSVQAADGFLQSLRIRRTMPAATPLEPRHPQNH